MEHYTPIGMRLATELPGPMLDRIARYSAGIAVMTGEPVTIRGTTTRGVYYCRELCQFDHAGSVVVLPDVMLIELVANGAAIPDTQTIELAEGRTAFMYAVTGQHTTRT
jgi:hypothetical protein